MRDSRIEDIETRKTPEVKFSAFTLAEQRIHEKNLLFSCTICYLRWIIVSKTWCDGAYCCCWWWVSPTRSTGYTQPGETIPDLMRHNTHITYTVILIVGSRDWDCVLMRVCFKYEDFMIIKSFCNASTDQVIDVLRIIQIVDSTLFSFRLSLKVMQTFLQ